MRADTFTAFRKCKNHEVSIVNVSDYIRDSAYEQKCELGCQKNITFLWESYFKD